MKSATTVRCLITAACCAVLLGAGAAAADQGGQRYAVTVTNLTRGQVLSPPVVVSHHASFRLFTPGEPAGAELAQLAEDAVSEPLLALLGTVPAVFDTAIAAGPVPPGQSATVEVSARDARRDISVAGMLVTTNDAFFAATGRARPHGRGPAFFAVAWDAGSEANTESCDHIPGPPCGHPLVRVTDGAEGYVHIHSGVHGTGDLTAADHDWRNPVAYVSIERVD